MATDTINAYLRTRVMTARPEELRLMLLEGAVKFARQGREGMAVKNHEQAFLGLSQARDIVLELVNGIRPDADPALASKVRSLYMFLYSELVNAGFERDLAKLDKVIEILEYERETWQLLIKKVGDERAAAAGTATERTEGRPSLSVQG